MSATPIVWSHIRGGRGPTQRRVSEVVDSDALVLGSAGAEAAKRRLGSAVLGAGPLSPLLDDPLVTDVLVNGTAGVWVERGGDLQRVPCDIGDADGVRRLAVRLAGLAERRLDEASPYVDGLLPGGVRLHAVLPPLVDGAAHISLRVPRRDVATLARLQRLGALPPAWADVLCDLVAGKHSFIISGGTGSGKTTLLAALLAQTPASERVVVVEDVRELAIDHPHVVRLQTRPSNVEGRGGVDMVTLVRQSLRMRPDRLVVGEVRGAEVREMLTALNTGHEGGCSTIHANTSGDLVARFEALGALAGLEPAATRAQLTSAIRVAIHVRRAKGMRYVESVGVLAETPGRGVTVQPALVNGPPRAAPGSGRGDGAPVSFPPQVSAGRRLEPGWTLLATLLGGGGER